MLNLHELYDVIFRKIKHFITPDVRTSNTTVNYLLYLFYPSYAPNTRNLIIHIKFAATINEKKNIV